MPVVRHKKYVKYVIKNQVIVGGSLGSLKRLFVNTHGDWERWGWLAAAWARQRSTQLLRQETVGKAH